MPNKHITEYLNYYIKLKYAPFYAVLVNGPWGSGKTFFIDNFLHQPNLSEKDYLYVSLYGATVSEDIDRAIFFSMYPRLNTTGAKFVGKAAKSALKYANIDFDLNLKDLINNSNRKIYIFDDIERTNMNIDQLFGNLNQYVEHDEKKVILLGNEDELKQKYDDVTYSKKREKLIGKTLYLSADVKSSLITFVDKIDDRKVREVIKSNSNDVYRIFSESDGDNLRTLQQSLWDFQRLYSVLHKDHTKISAGVNALLYFFLAISLEYKLGNIHIDDLRGRSASAIDRIIERKQEKSPLVISNEKYSNLDLFDSILSDSTLVDIISNGYFDKSAIHRDLSDSIYFLDQSEEPSWKTLWHFFDRSERDVEKAILDIEGNLKRREIYNPG